MIMKRHIGFLAAACLSMGANAAIIFQDNFDSEAGGIGVSTLNFTGFINWSVAEGTVDVVANGGWGISCAGGSGKCVDLDGSNSNAGFFSSHELMLTPGYYTLSVDLSGNQRGGADTMRMKLGSYVDEWFSLASTDPWQTVVRDFMVTSGSSEYITLLHDGGDNIGVMLDNVSLNAELAPNVTVVAEPSSMSLIGLGLIGLGVIRLKQRASNQT